MTTVLGVLVFAIIVLSGGVLAIASRRPDRFNVSRSMAIGAPPDRIFPLINDLKTMNTWDPFALQDPAAQAAYFGPASGAGATHTFSGRKAGTGWVAIVAAVPPSKVEMRLQMSKPFKADNAITFSIVPEGAGSRVTWMMTGLQPLLAKAATLFIDCDKMVGRQFETGLSSLKTLAERR